MSEMEFKKLSREMAGRNGAAGSAILLSVFAMVVLFFLWAGWAELDNVTRGEGRIVSSVQNQVVQSAESGVILRRYVEENSLVREGDILFEIDAVDATSELNRLKQRLNVLAIKEQRLQSEITGTDFAVEAVPADASATLVATELSLFTARKSELAGQLAVLEQRLLQRQDSIGAAENAKATAEKTAELLQQEIAMVEPLVRDNIAPATRLLELQRQLEGTMGEIGAQEAAVSQARSSIVELQAEVENAKANFVLRSMDELNAVVAEQSELRESLPRLEERVSRTLVRAPMDGIVSRLNYRTTGGFVKSGDVMLELVPTGEALMVEARIQPQDISRIRMDDAVKIRLSAYNSAKYGSVSGRVERISADAVADEANRGASYYKVDVAIEGDLVLEDGEVVTLIPGMTASVDVLSGKRTVLEYFWQPLARIQELALRD